MATTAHRPVTLTQRGTRRVDRLSRERWKRRGPLLPALIFTIVVTQLPFLLTLVYSLPQLEPAAARGAGTSRGSSNYIARAQRLGDVSRALCGHRDSSTVRRRGAARCSLGLACALLVDRKFLGRGVVRTLLIAPFLIMPAAAALLWKTTMLNPVVRAS